ncbi:MAG: hypothetical protein R2798_10520 [Chitinophagales bacterium]|nr:hypothetical protein [Bacteroidota bacterium]MCB9044010.1 hypothetical protein [Chitinophagales bacterium]
MDVIIGFLAFIGLLIMLPTAIVVIKAKANGVSLPFKQALLMNIKRSLSQDLITLMDLRRKTISP